MRARGEQIIKQAKLLITAVVFLLVCFILAVIAAFILGMQMKAYGGGNHATPS